jgi:outer membrane protein OmpA-like peptidoglycan-associated protein
MARIGTGFHTMALVIAASWLIAGDARAAQYDLSGEWVGTFATDNTGIQSEHVMVYQTGDQVRAVKITGDQNVPAGKETFHGAYTGNSFSGQQQCAHAGFKNAMWSNMTVVVADPSHFALQGGCGMATSNWKRLGKPVLALDDAILFDTGKSALKPEAGAAIDNIVRLIAEKHPKSRLTVAGYTDDVGGDAYNLELSRRRAASVAKALQAKGVADARLKTAGHGKADPRYPNTNDDARAHNRRVEIVIED